MDKGEAHKLSDKSPLIILVVGVNGSGKTTSIAKIAYRLQKRQVCSLAAADTFRAAASEQLQIWGERLGVGVIKHKEGADPLPLSLIGSRSKGQRNGCMICDTAGRLQNKRTLWPSLENVSRH